LCCLLCEGEPLEAIEEPRLGERIEGSGFVAVFAVRVGGEAETGASGKLEDLSEELFPVRVDSVTDVRDWRGLGEVDDLLERWGFVWHGWFSFD
jgi:hypothetical protein